MFKKLMVPFLLAALLFAPAPFVHEASQAYTLVESTTGNWTPSVGGTATYTTQSGTWIKVGKQVTVFCRMVINTIGTGSTATISGLPYPIDLTPIAYASAQVYFSSLSQSVSTVTALVGPNGVSTVTLYSLLSDGASQSANAIIGSGSNIFFSATYVTD